MNRIAQPFPQEDGFTLIELLIVIVILGILAGIAIFGVSAFKGDATNACNGANDRINQTVSAAQQANPSGTGYLSKTGSC
jgi:prepilin-type N-terminal cleavage/methylation domain-containing protein